ncbi:carbamoyltransferase [Parapedobacter luteus]|uniref:Carbamoyltransferase n=1 Tax=Parapedobacter luteus TaxID=623280 RepID=A0A1T5ETR1_9SPHI|nr:carbamoyltransferase N-terminal domain-containing protein [Parapedobacter luteus]SKB87291.1 carbamoyltransferase [Parapedobacter luteus]
MYTLGINAVFHDTAACIVKDGQLLAAVEDERFTRIKHGKRPIPFSTYELPFHAIDYCLQVAGIHLKDVDQVVYSFDPYLLIDENQAASPNIAIPFHLKDWEPADPQPWEGLFLSSIINASAQLVDGYPHHLQRRFREASQADWDWHFVEHHLSHAASAYLPSPFEDAAVMVLDGRGEIATTSYHVGQQQSLTRIGQVNLPHSLGLLYEEVTSYLGFLHSSDEYKVMALASYGKPTYAKDFRDMIYLSENGQYRIQQTQLEARFGPARLRHAALTNHHFDIARSLQYVLEETVLELALWLHSETKQRYLTMAGGVALNCVLNARIRDDGPFEKVWVQPAAGDSGTALGAALWADAKLRGERQKAFIMSHAYWGPAYEDDVIADFLEKAKVPYTRMERVAEETAQLLAANRIVGWFQGAMEYGPRALGSRSILASPVLPEMQAWLNEVKDREDFRPVAPVVTEEDAPLWFMNAQQSPFMLFVNQVPPARAALIPAVKHVDGTARIQTVNREQNPLYYDLLRAFEQITGIPVLINTSFNTVGRPIVCSPRDALECFWTSPFDVLIMGSFLISKQYGNKDISGHSHIQTASAFG